MQFQSTFLDTLPSIDESWSKFLSDDILKELKEIENIISADKAEFTPKSENVLRFLSKSLTETKVIILGQDPYPQKGVATGRAFEVGTLQSWDEKFTNVSLKNVIRSIYFAYRDKYLKYSEIKKEIGLYFPLSNPQELFVEWEKQGVLLLNTSFTCRVGESNSHEKYWRDFSAQLLNFIAKTNENIIWFLWGNNAKAIVNDIDIKNKIETMHPMMCYNKSDRTNDFLFGTHNCFKETKNSINWLG